MIGRLVVVSLIGAGQGLFFAVSKPLIKLLLWAARGSNHWREKWIGEEINSTNKRVLRGYLLREEIAHLEFLQNALLLKGPIKIDTKWEYLRLLAVMETVNNGSEFAQVLLEEAINPFQAGKLSLTPIVEWLLELLETITDGVTKPATLTSYNQFKSSEFCSKVNKLTKV